MRFIDANIRSKAFVRGIIDLLHTLLTLTLGDSSNLRNEFDDKKNDRFVTVSNAKIFI